MIIGVGVDLVEVDRFRKILKKSGAHFLRRAFTSQERRYCEGRARPWESYAARFAAKEAALKALGLGIGHDRLTQIEVKCSNRHTPTLVLHGVAAREAKRQRVKRCHLSLSHSSQSALAFVILER